MSGSHRVRSATSHRAPDPGSRRRRLSLAVVILLVITTVAGWRLFLYEGAPDVAEAGPGFWVSTRGDDGASGGPQDPWRTVQHAIDTVPDQARIFLREGEYDPFAVNRRDLTVTSAPGERATIVGRSGARDGVLIAASGVTVSNLTVRGCVPKPNADVNVTGDHGSGVRVHKTSNITVSGMVVRDSHGTNAEGLPVGCYGVLITESSDVRITESEVFGNGAGIGVSRGGQGVIVENNDIHDQDRIIVNTAVDNDDFGGYGMSATFVSDSPGPVFRNNLVRRNHGPSTDYGIDGGGMEIYDAQNVTITGNTFETNDGVMETGTGSGGGCENIVFTNNKAIGGTGGAQFDNDTGLVLRCATNMVVSGNTFSDMSKFTFLLATGADFAGRIDGLKITGNTVQRTNGTVIYRLQYDGQPPTGVSVNGNTYRSGPENFAVVDTTRPEVPVDFPTWQSRTSYDASSGLQ